jgi:alpha-D-ribose 1-methylphosphonate 5-triphosphate synthase subunit PhnG
MTNQSRSEGLAAAARVRRGALLELAGEIAERGDVEVIDRPAPGSVMVELDTSVGAFCFTEVVVTTARVHVGGTEGWAAVLGWDAEAALASALCDAAGDERTTQLAEGALADEAGQRLERMRAVAATKV